MDMLRDSESVVLFSQVSLLEIQIKTSLKKLELDLVVIAEADLDRVNAELPGVQVTVKPPDEKQRSQILHSWKKKP